MWERERRRKGSPPQWRLILDRLQRGPATGEELAALSPTFTTRIWELKNKKGVVVEVWHKDLKPNATVYGLGPKPDGWTWTPNP